MWNWITKLEELRAAGVPVVLVTLTQATGSTPREPGAKMLVLGDGEFYGTVGGGNLEQLALEDARKFLNDGGGSRSVRYPLGAKTGQCCGGVVELFFDIVNAGPRLYLFGAGHVGQAVCRTLVGTPFQVHLIDEREEWVHSKELPSTIIKHHVEWDEFVRDADWRDDRTYIVVMTHRHDTDQDIVEDVIKRQTRYVGLIGSESKWERFKQRLTARGVSERELSRVKCPIGLNVGGKAPQEVAISLAAELLSDYYRDQK